MKIYCSCVCISSAEVQHHSREVLSLAKSVASTRILKLQIHLYLYLHQRIAIMNFSILTCLCVVLLQIASNECSVAKLYSECHKTKNGKGCIAWSRSYVCEIDIESKCKNVCWPDFGSCCDCKKRKKCFPSNSKVKLANGNSVMMSELQLGDQVQTGNNSSEFRSCFETIKWEAKHQTNN